MKPATSPPHITPTEAAGLAVLFLLIAVVLTWPLALHIGSLTPYNAGDVHLNAYLIAWVQHALLHRPFDLFSPNFFHPAPNMLALSENLIAPALLALPLAPSGNPLLVYNCLMIGSLAVSAWVMWLVLRLWGIERTAALVGALCWGFLPWKFGQLGHIQLLFGWWIPLVLWGVDGWLAGRRRGALIAASALAAQFYSSVYLFYFTVLFVVPFAVAGLCLERPDCAARRRLLRLAGEAAGLLLILLAPAVGPYRDVKLMIADPNPIGTLEVRGALLTDYLRPSPFNLIYGQLSRFGPSPVSDLHWEHLLWPGWGALVLALLWPLGGHARRQQGDDSGAARRRGWMVLAAGVALWLVSLGPVLHWRGERLSVLPWYGWLHAWLPGFDAIRVPSRAASLVGLALAVLAAYGLQGLLGAMRRRWRFGWARAVGMLIVALVLADLLNHPLLLPDSPDLRRYRQAHARIAAFDAPGAVLVLPADPATGFLAPLASTEHFRPLVNGASGYMPPDNGRLLDFLRQAEWTEVQPEILRWLDVRYVLIDRLAPGATAVPLNLEERLREAGMLAAVYPDVAEGMDLMELSAGSAEIGDIWPEQRLWVNRLFIEERHSVVGVVSYAGPPHQLTVGERRLKVRLRGYDASGRRIWNRTFRARLPHFLLDGQLCGYEAELSERQWSATAEVLVEAWLPGLDLELREAYRRD